MLATFGVVLTLVWHIRQELIRRIFQLSITMQRLANGNLYTEIPEGGPVDELDEMTLTLSSFKASLIERERLTVGQAAAAAALLDEKERLRVTLHSIGDGMIVTDAERQVIMMNATAEEMTGWNLADALETNIEQVLTLTYQQDEAQGDSSLDRVIASDALATAIGDATLIRPDGAELAIDASAALIFGQEGSLIGTITVLHDVTESRRLLKRISQLAHFDVLTGLPNRALFHDRLGQAILHAQRTKLRCALLFLDMDRFKHVNDTLGHTVGDLLLREVAQRLMLAVRKGDTVARLGGDEFVIIISNLVDNAAAVQTAHKILASIADIDRVAGHELAVSFSIGIAIYPDDALDVDELLMRADAAMYQAKDSGRNTCMFFDRNIDRATQRRNTMRLRLAKALHLHQFVLLYQPKIDLHTGRITGAEALIRWYPEPGEMISPVDFIPIAEESGLILPISDWVLNEVCRQIRSWTERKLPLISVAINVSMRSLCNPGFAATLHAALNAAAVPAQALELEITESTAIADPERTFAILAEVRALGVRVAIDDFGTGFSSLSRLHRLPVDTIKIDRTFVRNMMEIEEDAMLVSAIIGMATNMRKHVIAEGVESEMQRIQLLRFGCHEGQGFLFSKPVGAAEFERMLAEEQENIPA